MDCIPCLRRRHHEDSKFGNAKVVHHSGVPSSQERGSTGSYNSNQSNVPFSPTPALQPGRPGGALKFTIQELNKITGNFSESHKIGHGGFGTVYKGKLRDGTTVAIKRARKDAFETRVSREFQTEVDMLSQVEHLNLVRLMGFLEEKNERILVTEYVPNGNLREHLDGTTYGVILDMSKRLNIAIDVAQALTYLHYYTDRPIIHRDVKASNILITDTFRAKVADFGISRAGPSEDGVTHVSTQVKGTAEYLDPEYLTTYQLNVKSDVYSFGILLVELFTGRRPIELGRSSSESVTIKWAFKQFVDGKLKFIIDPKMHQQPGDSQILERIFELAFACSAPTKKDRPNMNKVKEVLWNIRKDYQLNQQSENYDPDHYANDSFDNNSRGPPRTPRGSRYSGDSESAKTRTSRWSEDAPRH